MAAGEPLDYAANRPRRVARGERAWLIAEVLAAGLTIFLVACGLLSPLIAAYLFWRWEIGFRGGP
jgi:hypothetical protein